MTLIWVALLGVSLAALSFAAASPLLAWRDPVYIAAGFAGVLALVVMVLQPLLAARDLPGQWGPRVHRAMGALLVLLVVAHVVGLWLTSPPDVVDVLLFRSPTPFSVWGVVAMWALFGAAVLVVLRRRWKVAPKVWRRVHGVLVAVVVAGTVVHALQIEGTMEGVTKAVLCVAVVVALGRAFWRRGTFAKGRR